MGLTTGTKCGHFHVNKATPPGEFLRGESDDVAYRFMQCFPVSPRAPCRLPTAGVSGVPAQICAHGGQFTPIFGKHVFPDIVFFIVSHYAKKTN